VFRSAARRLACRSSPSSSTSVVRIQAIIYMRISVSSAWRACHSRVRHRRDLSLNHPDVEPANTTITRLNG
jgi:hypothetical protein